MRFSLRTATAPFARESAAVSASCSPATAAVMAATVGVGVGNDGLFVSFCTTLLEKRMKSEIFLGSPGRSWREGWSCCSWSWSFLRCCR